MRRCGRSLREQVGIDGSPVLTGDSAGVSDTVAALDAPLVIAVDNDTAGRAAADVLIARLGEHGRRDVTRLTVPGDLNDLAARTGSRFPAVMHAAVRGSRRPAARGLTASR